MSTRNLSAVDGARTAAVAICLGHATRAASERRDARRDAMICIGAIDFLSSQASGAVLYCLGQSVDADMT